MRSIRFRLVALSVMISGAALVSLSWFLYRGIVENQQIAFDTSLYNHTVDIAGATDMTIIGQLVVKREVLIDEKKILPFALGQSMLQIRGLDDAVYLSSRPVRYLKLPLSPKTALDVVNQGAIFETIKSDGKEYRLVHYLLQKPPLPPLILQVAVPTTMLQTERAQVLSLLFTLIPIALVASAIGGFLVARRALNPVDRIIKTARLIQAKELSARVPVPKETEFRELALTLNELLSRLQRAFDGQEKFIADASHQLKTPLAIIRGEIDVYRRTTQTDGALELLKSVSQEVDQLSKLVDDLLLLARFDSGLFQPTFTPVRIDEVLLEAVSKLDRLSREAGIEIRLNFTSPGGEQISTEASAYEMQGDFDLLKVLFFNIIENAIKYSPRPGHIEIRLRSDPKSIQIDFEDHGPGINADELPRIFDRFFRGGERQHQAPGVGLGLSIASRIANLHNIELGVSSPPGQGAVFSVRIKNV